MQHPAHQPLVGATGQDQQDLGPTVPSQIGGELGGGAHEASVGTLDHVQGDGVETQLAPVLGQPSGSFGIEDEVHGAHLSAGRQ